MAQSITKSMIVSAIILGLSGCAALPFLGATGGGGSNASDVDALASSVPKPSFFDYIGYDIQVAYMSPGALLDDSLTLEAAILQQQCRFRTPDPVFLVPASSSVVMFEGLLNEDQNFRVLSYKNLLYLGLARGSPQLNRWPVRFAALGEMPRLFLEERLDLAAKAKLPAPQQQALAQEFIDDSKKIQTTVERLERDFNPVRECPLRNQRP